MQPTAQSLLLVDTPYLQQTYDKVHVTPNVAFDLSQTSD